MTAFNLVVLTLACLGCVYYLASTIALVRYFSRKNETDTAGPLPSVSVLKPVCGVDADARSNLESFLNQDYPDYEVLYGILDESDPACELVRGLIHGKSRASLHMGSDAEGANNKVKILHTLTRYAKSEILVIADADTRVAPDCLQQVCKPFSDPSVGVVTCMYRGVEAKSMADMVEALHMTCVFEPGVACAGYLGADFGLGALIAVRRTALDAIGGFSPLAHYLADDYQLAHRISQNGQRIVLSDYVVDIVLSGESPKSVILRLLRWSQTLKVCNPRGYFGLMPTYGTAWAILFWLGTGLSAAGLAVTAGIVSLRLATAYVGAYRYLKDREFLVRIPLLPVCDVLGLTLWIGAWFTKSVWWRGRKLTLSRDGRIFSDKLDPFYTKSSKRD